MWIGVAQKQVCCFNVTMNILIFMYIFQSIQLGRIKIEKESKHHHHLHFFTLNPTTKYFSLMQ